MERLVVAVAAAVSVVLAGCGSTAGTGAAVKGPDAAPASRVIQAVAAENFWGSIAAQIGGSHVHLISIISKPDTDPHSYEPTAADARTLAEAGFVIENGIGYDPWVPKLLGADQTHPTVLDVGRLVGAARGDNPHRWYNPADVHTVIERIASDFQKLDPADAPYFAEQKARFETVALAGYDTTVSAIRARYSGTPVGASESIVAMLAPALGLDLVTPGSFLKAISEGTDVSAADKRTIDHQIKTHQIRMYIYNSQNVTPDVRVQVNEVKAEHIPYTTITETMSPAGTTYQAWQTAELLGIENALAAGAGGR